jgi:NitT/TauT family transport system substrate-binding protein
MNSDALVTSVKKERPELAVVPINLAAKLYNENEKSTENQYKLLGVSTWGLNEIVANFNLSSLKDLVGKKLYSFGKSETPGIILRALLKKEGIEYVDFKDNLSPTAVNIVDYTAAPDIVAELSRDLNEEHVALLPQPVASAFELKTQGKYSVKLDLQALIKQVFDGLKYPQAGLIVRSDIANNQNYKDFLQKLAVQIEKTAPLLEQNPEQVAKYMKENFNSSALASTEAVVHALKANRLDVEFAPVFASSAGSNGDNESGSGRTTPEKARHDVKELLQIIYDSGASALIGGKVPDEKFFALDEN